MPPLVPRTKILLPPLHIKLGLVTQLFKTLQRKNNNVLCELKRIFPTMTDAKLVGAVFDGPQIRILADDKNLPSVLEEDKKAALEHLKEVCGKFLGNERTSNYKEIV